MLTSIEIKKIIDKKEKQLKKLNDFIDNYHKNFRSGAAPELKFTDAEIKNNHIQYNKICKQKNKLSLEIQLLKDNLKVSKYNELLPVALNILKKYSGKSYGDKTREKICNEMKQQVNCALYVHTNNLYFVPLNNEGYSNYTDFEAHTEYNNIKFLNNDNKIQVVSPENVYLPYYKHTEDIPGTIKEMKKLNKKAADAQKTLEKFCSQFNNLAPSTFNSLNYREFIYNYTDF